ncbi:MAG: hypothetical protein J7J76_00750 [Candidatus Latescibacteria bacterium]|nr:hypothetical protein [Candidatus Latescibacterota bacterium]
MRWNWETQVISDNLSLKWDGMMVTEEQVNIIDMKDEAIKFRTEIVISALVGVACPSVLTSTKM